MIEILDNRLVALDDVIAQVEQLLPPCARERFLSRKFNSQERCIKVLVRSVDEANLIILFRSPNAECNRSAVSSRYVFVPISKCGNDRDISVWMVVRETGVIDGKGIAISRNETSKAGSRTSTAFAIRQFGFTKFYFIAFAHSLTRSTPARYPCTARGPRPTSG